MNKTIFLVVSAFCMLCFNPLSYGSSITINGSNTSEANLLIDSVNANPGNLNYAGKSNPAYDVSIMNHLYPGQYAPVAIGANPANPYILSGSYGPTFFKIGTGAAQVVAKFAGNGEQLGFYEGPSGPIGAGTFNAITGVINANGYISSSTSSFNPSVQPFRFGLLSGGQYFSTDPTDNADGMPHAVVFKLISGPSAGDFVIAFEDLLYGSSDFDYNDVVFQLHNIDPVGSPEPGTYLILGSTLAMMGLLSLRKKAII